MKTILNIHRCVTFGLLLMLCSCQSPDPVGTQSKEDTTMVAQPLHEAPVTSAEYYQLKMSAMEAFGISGSAGNHGVPSFVNPMINMSALIAFYEQHNQQSIYSGLRFYPAIKNNSLMLIVCLDNSENTTDEPTTESDYFLLSRSLYLDTDGSGLNSERVPSDTARHYLREYLSKIRLYANSYPATTPYPDTLRTSRYYSWRDIMYLIEQNNSQQLPMQDYYIQIDIAYVPEGLARAFITRMEVIYTQEQHQGFTVIMHIKDKLGNAVMDPFSRYNASDNSEMRNYRGRGLEVGTPCPPRCGVLSS